MPEPSAICTLVPSPLREERKTVVERRGPAVDVPRYRGICSGGTVRIHDLQLNDTKRNVESVLVQCACGVPVAQDLSGRVRLRSIPLSVGAVGRNTHVDDLLTRRTSRPISDVVYEAKGQI
jgi:hypothetical protein